MEKVLQDLDLKAKDEVSKLEDELLNPDSHLNSPVVKVAVDGAEIVNDVGSMAHKVENVATDVIDRLEMPIGFPGHGV